MLNTSDSLRARLAYEPRELNFGTSGRRGEVAHLTQLEIYINARAELEYLQSLTAGDGGIRRGDEFFFAYDLRPSSTRFVPEQHGRGEICQAIELAISDAGMRPVNLGQIPTPALTAYAINRSRGSIMVTGSHIPFDRNGYKLNTSRGELLKEHEVPVNRNVARVREQVYARSYADSPFDEHGYLKGGHRDLGPESSNGAVEYVDRYRNFFGEGCLKGMRVVAYQHSSVGRDLLVDTLTLLGAEVIPAGRSETFVPIDTENIDAGQLAVIQELTDLARAEHGRIDTVVSTDGDSDRPLLLGVDPGTGGVRFFGGDLVGMVVADFLHADAVVVPISCNDAIDRGSLADVTEPKTRIGSPYVIAGMEKARERGRKNICGWEANGGFLTGSDIHRGSRMLPKLPTRDAFLPLFSVLVAAQERNRTVADVFGDLPKRYSRAALLTDFPRSLSQRMIARFSAVPDGVREVAFDSSGATLIGEDMVPLRDSRPLAASLQIRQELEVFFSPALGFSAIVRLNYTDGVRVWFANGDVAHIRPSGNADEFRIYAVADTQERADEIVRLGVGEPDGILLQMKKAITDEARSPGSGALSHHMEA